MKILIFEDEKWKNLLPLTFIKCVFDIRCGYTSLWERICSVLPDGEKELWVREYIKDFAMKKYNLPVNDNSLFNDDLLIVNGRWVPEVHEKISISEEKVITCQGELIYGLITREKVQKFWDGDIEGFIKAVKENIKTEEKQTRYINYPWDLIVYNPELLKEDFVKYGKKGIKGNFHQNAVIVGNIDEVYIEEGAKVHPLVVIDASHGPVYIDRDVEIFPSARIEGPCYIGKETQIMPGANIREGNSFGEVCRIGGEVEESIFYSYSNKYHDGFIGHSYIGEFVNLGALTTNSDLKNDYSCVSVYLNGKPFDTGLLKVGSFIGDHTKTSIGTLFNTGTIAGLMCNITAGGILPKYFPSFTWYVNSKFMKGYGLDMMICTARTAMERRKRQLIKEEEEVIRYVYEMTEDERKEAIKKSRKAGK